MDLSRAAYNRDLKVALESPAYGYRRITCELQQRGFAVHHKRVLPMMREDNLLCVRRRRFVVTTDSRHNLAIYPNLAREMKPMAINQLWVADITYIRLRTEFVYLAVVLDAFSRGRVKNLPIVRAYYLKEAFQLFWFYRQPKRAGDHLDKWMRSATRSQLEPFKKFVRLLKGHLDGILSWTKSRVSNGAVEGMNNKIKSIIHRSFGFRTVENFIAAIYHCSARLPLPIER